MDHNPALTGPGRRDIRGTRIQPMCSNASTEREATMAEQPASSIYERDALEAVPHNKRDFTWLALVFIFMGIQVPVSYFITGGSATAGLSLGSAFGATVVAAVVGFLIFALVGIIGWQ